MISDLAEREAEIRRVLDRVTDPELDEPVTDLRFIGRLAVDPDGNVVIGFRLPTYWCAANFAFLMAADMQREIGALSWVRQVDIILGEHMYAEKINHGLANRMSFQATFGSDASAELDELRRIFLVKAFQRRQEALLRHLIKQGLEPAALTLEALQTLPLDDEGNRLRARYLDKRDVCAKLGEQRAFVDSSGNPVTESCWLSANSGARLHQRRVQRRAVPWTVGCPVQRRWRAIAGGFRPHAFAGRIDAEIRFSQPSLSLSVENRSLTLAAQGPFHTGRYRIASVRVDENRQPDRGLRERAASCFAGP
jgi:metal-sulfur cluster biosynthetic enzyme